MSRIVLGGGEGGASAPPPALDADLEAIAALTPANDDLIQRKAGAWTNRTPTQVKTDLAVTKADVGLANVDNTSDAAKPVSTAMATALAGKADDAATTTALAGKQPLDSDLTAIAALAPANDDVIQRKAGAWTNRTLAQLKTDLAIASAPVQLNGTSDAIIPVDNADSFVIGSDRMDRDAADATKDIRAFFSKTNGAFRAGVAAGATWDSANRGSNSAAFGSATQASGSASFAAGFNSSATANYSSAVGQGVAATASAAHAEGSGTAATGTWSHAEGVNTLASGAGAHAEGSTCTASGTNSHAEGEYASASRYAQHAKASGRFTATGDAQCNKFVARRESTNATPGVLTFDSAAVMLTGADTNVLTIPASKAHQFRVSVIARRTDVAGEAAGWEFSGVIARDASGNARLVGTTAARSWGDAGAANYDVTLSIDTTNATNYLTITTTGEAAKTIRWVATIDTTEVG